MKKQDPHEHREIMENSTETVSAAQDQTLNIWLKQKPLAMLGMKSYSCSIKSKLHLFIHHQQPGYSVWG